MRNAVFDADSYSIFLKKRAQDDLNFAEFAIWEHKRMGDGLYFAHASIQKILAAQICKQTSARPPWRIDLIKLAKLANARLTKEQREFCKILNFYHREGLYLGLRYPQPSKKEASNYLLRAKELATWLTTLWQNKKP